MGICIPPGYAQQDDLVSECETSLQSWLTYAESYVGEDGQITSSFMAQNSFRETAFFVGPVVWLLNDAEISLFHRLKPKTKIPAVHGFLIGMTNLYGFALGPFLFVFLETERDYLLTLTLLPLMLYTIFMFSLAATLLYLILSHKRCMNRFLKSVSKEPTYIKK